MDWSKRASQYELKLPNQQLKPLKHFERELFKHMNYKDDHGNHVYELLIIS